MNLKDSLIDVIEKHHIDDTCETPSWIVADYLLESLRTFTSTIETRGKWNVEHPTTVEPIKTNDPNKCAIGSTKRWTASEAFAAMELKPSGG